MSGPQVPIATDEQIEEAQIRMQEQRVRLQRMIAQGAIAQSDDDLLREMHVNLKRMRAARRATRVRLRSLIRGLPDSGVHWAASGPYRMLGVGIE